MKTYSAVILQIFIILVIGITFMGISSLFFSKEKSPEELVEEVVREVIISRPTCPDTFESYSGLRSSGGVITLVKSAKSYGIPGDGFVNPQLGTLKVSGSGSQVACGYLYVQAHVASRPLEEWENLYMKLGDFGGHLVRDASIVERESTGGTELLFKLGTVLYREDGSKTETTRADWAALLNVTNRIDYTVALNTGNSEGVIDEASIVYKCWSPETGKETSDCKLNIE